MATFVIYSSIKKDTAHCRNVVDTKTTAVVGEEETIKYTTEVTFERFLAYKSASAGFETLEEPEDPYKGTELVILPAKLEYLNINDDTLSTHPILGIIGELKTAVYDPIHLPGYTAIGSPRYNSMENSSYSITVDIGRGKVARGKSHG